jgi:hypothetical protein
MEIYIRILSKNVPIGWLSFCPISVKYIRYNIDLIDKQTDECVGTSCDDIIQAKSLAKIAKKLAKLDGYNHVKIEFWSKKGPIKFSS